MAVNKEELLETISNMTVLEVVELVEAMEEKFGVSAAVAAAPAAAGAAAGDGAAAEEKAARFIHTLPYEAVIFWGQRIGAPGADVVSYNLKTKTVTLWDVKWRGKPVRLRPSTTFEQGSKPLTNALKQASDAVWASKLSKQHKDAAIESINTKAFQTRTLGAGNAKNSTFSDHR